MRKKIIIINHLPKWNFPNGIDVNKTGGWFFPNTYLLILIWYCIYICNNFGCVLISENPLINLIKFTLKLVYCMRSSHVEKLTWLCLKLNNKFALNYIDSWLEVSFCITVGIYERNTWRNFLKVIFTNRWRYALMCWSNNEWVPGKRILTWVFCLRPTL